MRRNIARRLVKRRQSGSDAPASTRSGNFALAIAIWAPVRNIAARTVDGCYSRFEKQMPELATFAEQNIDRPSYEFTGNTTDNGIFSLFCANRGLWMACYPAGHYGARTALNQQGYQLGLFSFGWLRQPRTSQAFCPISRPRAAQTRI